MKTFKQIDKMWQDYCDMSTVELENSITIAYTPSEVDKHKVEIFCNNKYISMSTAEARLLAETLLTLTSDEEIQE